MLRLIALAVFLTALCFPPAANAADFEEGKNYFTISEPEQYEKTDKIEVIMFFWYGCSGCYKVDPRVEKWQNALPGDVTFKRLPAIFFPHWEIHARIFYTLEEMGVPYETHRNVATIIEGKQLVVEAEEELPPLLDKINVNRDDFMRIFNSAKISEKIDNLYPLLHRFGLSSVPAMVINGKYQYNSKSVDGKHFLNLADYIIDMERKAKAK